MIDSEDTMRARFLMSPYNVQEARRAQEFKRAIWVIGLLTIGLLTIVGLALFGTIIYWH
jgi:hypothetical protein